MKNDAPVNIDPPAQSLVCEIPCKLISLTMPDGYESYARFFSQPGSSKAVLYLHGIQSHGGWFLRSCDYLNRDGWNVLAPDRRGSGLNQQQRGHCDNPEQLISDVDSCVNWLIENTGVKKIDIVAVSWSGKLAMAYAGRFPEKLQRLVLVTPGLCARVDITLREKISVGIDGLAQPHKQHEIPLNEPTLFTANEPMLQFLRNDPLKLTHATASFFITSVRLDNTVRQVVNKIQTPVYLFLAGQDKIIDNQATVNLLKPILKSTPGRQNPVIYPQAHHTLDFEPDPQNFFADLADLLNQIPAPNHPW
jgi:alpha-beta hydrolase superfamily lysophospholipase